MIGSGPENFKKSGTDLDKDRKLSRNAGRNRPGLRSSNKTQTDSDWDQEEL